MLETKSQQFQDKVNNAPKLPGCYMYIDKSGKIIYVGKAKILRNRIKSYFINYKKLDVKIQTMIEHAVDINYVTVDSEVEALILETNLIKKYHPKYNSMMMDDKNYSWIMVEKPVKGVRDFPRIKIVKDKNDPKAEYFGPYPNTLPLKNILKRIRKVFPYVSCNRRLIQVKNNPLEVDTNNSVPCLYYHIGLCPAPCASLIDKQDYAKNINNIKKFLKGEKNEILHELETEMAMLSKNMEFEEAAKIRDKINDIKYVTRSIKIDRDVDDIMIHEFKKKERAEAINQLIEELGFPEDKLKYHPGFKIECYDISNIQGSNSVGSMTVMVDGVLRKDLYRKFRIRQMRGPEIKSTKNKKEALMTPNDYAMHQEVLGRRLKYLLNQNLEGAVDEPRSDMPEELDNINEIKDLSEDFVQDVAQNTTKRTKDISKNLNDIKYDESFSVKPDLIIIDGGKGQLSAAFKVLKNYGLDNEIPIVGLAKREEEIFKIQWQFNTDDWPDLALKRFKRIMLNKRSEALYLVQRIRDEAHRFGITYHRKLRSKKMLIA